MIETTANKYFICFRSRKTVRKKVICFPPAGVGASFYSKWHQRVPDDVEIWAAQLPAREFKSEQALPTFLKVLVGAFVADIQELTEGEYEFYGHSFGAAQAVLVAQRLRNKQGPSRIVVAARRPVHLPYTVELSQQSDTTLFRYLNTLGGISPSVAADKYVLARFMKLVRSDLALNEQAYAECDGLVGCPIEFVAAAGDIAISIKESERWGELTKKGFKLHLVEGDHFFVNDPEHAFYSQIYSSNNPQQATKKVRIDEFFTS